MERVVANYPQMTTRQVAAEVSLPPTTAFRFLTEDLGFKNLLSVLVPHNLSDSNKSQRVECCRELLKLFLDHGEKYLGSRLFVQDESWFYFEPQERRLAWVEPTGARLPTARVKLTTKKTIMLIGFTCKPKRISIQALPPGTKADRKTMIEYLKKTGK